MKLTNKEKQLVKEYAKKLQSKKLNETMDELEIIREKALNRFQLMFDSWSSMWKRKIIVLAKSSPDVDPDELWSEIVQDALSGVSTD